MYIPTTPKISKECEDLLRRLIEPEPMDRIEWEDFFNHDIFKNYVPTKNRCFDVKKSVMFRNNEQTVIDTFRKNKETAKDINTASRPMNPVDMYSSPKNVHIRPKDRVEKKKGSIISHNIDTNLINLTLRRYIHEKKMIVYIMQTCRKLRNLSKQRYYLRNGADGLLFIALLLLKKGIMLNKNCLGSIRNG